MDRCPRKNHERMMIGSVAREESHRGAHFGASFGRKTGAKIKLVGNLEAEQSPVEVHGSINRCHVDAKVTEPPDLKGAGKPNAVNACWMRFGYAHWIVSWEVG